MSTFSSPRTFASLVLFPLLAAFAAGCGSTSDGMSGAGNGGNPDPLAAQTIRNDCSMNVRRTLGTNVGDSTAWIGPHSRFGAAPAGWPKARDWSPLAAASETSSTYQSSSVSSFGNGHAAPACDPLLALFASDTEGMFNTDSYVEHHMELESNVIDFPFATDVSKVGDAPEAIAVQVKPTLRLRFQRPLKRSDGTFDHSTMVYRDSDVQEWTLGDVDCAKPFTVLPLWTPEAESAGDSTFCRADAAGARKCLSYAVRYTADACKFTIRDATFRTVDGTEIRATVAGHFDRNAASSDGEPRGYSVAITNVELH